MIRRVRDVVFPEIISKSVPYYRYNVAEAIANLNDAYSVCASAWNEIYDASDDGLLDKIREIFSLR